MLVTLIAYFFLVSGDEAVLMIQKLDNYVQNMQNNTKKEKLVKNISDIKVILKEYVEITKESTEFLEESFSNRKLAKEILINYNEKREISLQKIYDIRFKVRENLTKEEWMVAFE